VIDKILWPRLPPWSWAYNYVRKSPESEYTEKRQEWIDGVSLQTRKLREWGPLPETRVDVSEAADALQFQQDNSTPSDSPKSSLYECLFVGKEFNNRLLSRINFRRCTFVRCSFDLDHTKDLSFHDSLIFNCRVLGENSTVSFFSSQLCDVRFYRNTNSDIVLESCEAYSIRILGGPRKLSINDCSFFQLRVPGSRRTPKEISMTIDLTDSALVESQLSNLRLTSESMLQILESSEINIDGLDLSEVTDVSSDDLSGLNATPRTIHPAGSPRPSGWPEYESET
jgi:uncharacterized protein YjbI with pentapeptide repeats